MSTKEERETRTHEDNPLAKMPPLAWGHRVRVPDVGHAELKKHVDRAVADESERKKHPPHVRARVAAAAARVVELAKAHGTGPAELEMLETKDGTIQVCVKHDDGRATASLVVDAPEPPKEDA